MSPSVRTETFQRQLFPSKHQITTINAQLESPLQTQSETQTEFGNTVGNTVGTVRLIQYSKIGNLGVKENNKTMYDQKCQRDGHGDLLLSAHVANKTLNI